MIKGFMTFVREQGIVGLAVGLAIGTEAGRAVGAVVDGFISPIIGYILGSTDLSALTWEVAGKAGDTRHLVIGWGAIVQAAITLVAVAFVIYWLVHKAGLDKMDKKK